MKSSEAAGRASAGREFTNEELTEIIREAARRSRSTSRSSRVSYDEMLSIGRELGIDHDALESAANDLGKIKNNERNRIKRRLEFFQHLMTYGIVILALFFINLITSPSYWWFLFPAIGWGIGVGCHATAVYFSEKAAMHGIQDFNGEDGNDLRLELTVEGK